MNLNESRMACLALNGLKNGNLGFLKLFSGCTYAFIIKFLYICTLESVSRRAGSG